MTSNNNVEQTEQQIRSKTLLVLGLTFVLPILATLIAVYIML